MFEPPRHTLRVFLHLLAAAIWVGGQLTLAGLVPTLRGEAPDAVRPAARRFVLLAWPAFGVLVATGIWNLVAIDIVDTSTTYQVTLFVKLLLLAASGVGAAAHQIGRSKAELAVGGVVGTGAVGALFLGTLLIRHGWRPGAVPSGLNGKELVGFGPHLGFPGGEQARWRSSRPPPSAPRCSTPHPATSFPPASAP